MTKTPKTEDLYDAQAGDWARSQQILLSDFTARPQVIDALHPLEGTHVLDLGCGEGYVSRLAMRAGSASVFGVDISPKMIAHAQAAARRTQDLPMHFEVGDAATLNRFPRGCYDRIIAVFLFNYVTRKRMVHILQIVRERLAPGGRFVFTVPHPCFPYMRPPQAPFFFDTAGHDYFTGADHTYEGRIWRRDGTDVAVRCVHKTVVDYFDALAAAGWTTLPRMRELHVTADHLEMEPEFFGPLRGLPLHLLFSLEANQ